MDRNQAEELSHAAETFMAAVQQYSRAAEQLAESQIGLERIARTFYLLSLPGLEAAEGSPRRPLLFSYVGAGGLAEEKSATLAWNAVHDSRGSQGDIIEGLLWEAPSPEEVRERREARKRQEPS